MKANGISQNKATSKAEAIAQAGMLISAVLDPPVAGCRCRSSREDDDLTNALSG